MRGKNENSQVLHIFKAVIHKSNIFKQTVFSFFANQIPLKLLGKVLGIKPYETYVIFFKMSLSPVQNLTKIYYRRFKTHHLSLIDKIVLAHGALFHHLDGHIRGALPLAVAHHAKLAAAQLFKQGELGRVDLPLAVAETGGGRLGTAGRRL